MSYLLGCPVVDCTVLIIYNSIFNSQWVKFTSGGYYVLRNMQTTDLANSQQNQMWQFRWLLWSCGDMCIQKGCLYLKNRHSNSCLFSVYPSHYSHLHTHTHTHTMISVISSSKNSCLLYEQQKESNRPWVTT